MNDKKVFCLLDEPWLKVQKQDFSTDTVSLKALFANAHQYRGLAGAVETENVAVFRFLLAVLHTVVSRYDYSGNDESLEDEDDAYNRWEDYWNNGCFPKEVIDGYLEKWRDSFWLIHPYTPFMQVATLSTTVNTPKEKASKVMLRKINPELVESNNKKNLFAIKNIDEDKDNLCFSDAARALIYLINYDDCAIKPTPKQTWTSKLGHIYAIGRNLFETLMLNLCLLDENDCVWPYSKPVWENSKVITSTQIPDNPAQLFTMLARHTLFEYSEPENKIVNILVKAGEAIADDNIKNFFVEYLTKWRLVTEKNKNSYYKPCIYDNTSPVWREFSFIFVNDEEQHVPGVVNWLYKLAEETTAISFQNVISFKFLSITYLGGTWKSGIDNIYTDQISFQLELLKSFNDAWFRLVTDSIKLCEDVCKLLKKLDSDCQNALGLADNDKMKNAISHSWFNSIDTLFRLWLEKLRPAEGNDLILQVKIELWRSLKIKADENAEAIINKYGLPAFIGRIVAGKRYTIPDAYNKFKRNLNKLIPNVALGGHNEE